MNIIYLYAGLQGGYMANQYLIDARLSKRWSEDKTSQQVGISKKTYCRLEAGRVPSMNTL